jgi:hypothetical protein
MAVAVGKTYLFKAATNFYKQGIIGKLWSSLNI